MKTKDGFVSLSFEQWQILFRPIKNTGEAQGPLGGLFFETFGQDLSQVLLVANGHTGRAGSRKVWTLVENDDGDPVIVSGYHLVNRIGYFITERPGASGVFYEISL